MCQAEYGSMSIIIETMLDCSGLNRHVFERTGSLHVVKVIVHEALYRLSANAALQ